MKWAPCTKIVIIIIIIIIIIVIIIIIINKLPKYWREKSFAWFQIRIFSEKDDRREDLNTKMLGNRRAANSVGRTPFYSDPSGGEAGSNHGRTSNHRQL